MNRTDDETRVTLADSVDLYDEETTIAAQDLFVALWSQNAARDSRRVKRQTLHARRHGVPVVVVALPNAPPLPPWLEGAPVIPFEGASTRIREDQKLGKILGRWEGSD